MNLEPPRQFYDSCQQQGRHNQQQSEDASQAIIGQMLTWAFKSAPDVESKRRDRRADFSLEAPRESDR